MEPWGDERADLRSALVAQAAAFGYRKENNEPFTLNDFLPFRDRPEPTLDDIKNAWANVFDG